MKKPRFTEQQVAQPWRQAEHAVHDGAEICRKLGVSEATFYAWKKRIAGMGSPSSGACASRGRKSPLKQVVADLTLDKQMLQEVLQKKV